jgi:hypothetical protein
MPFRLPKRKGRDPYAEPERRARARLNQLRLRCNLATLSAEEPNKQIQRRALPVLSNRRGCESFAILCEVNARLMRMNAAAPIIKHATLPTDGKESVRLDQPWTAVPTLRSR